MKRYVGSMAGVAWKRLFQVATIGTLSLIAASSVQIAADAQDGAVIPNERPNILWITCEDMSPNLGCYDDTFASTPNLDALAARGVRFTHAFAPIGVCAPARSSLITGIYANSLGSHHMRSRIPLPRDVRCFPEYLRKAGYYCTNNAKTDYNFQHPRESWDDSGNSAHWRNRKEGQPFFSVFNLTVSHESQIRIGTEAFERRLKNHGVTPHDPNRASVPPYHPDVPDVRRDWAIYADMVSVMDVQVGRVLAELEADGLAEDTIIMFFSDHGAGMPRSKRWLYDSGIHVPLIVCFPKRFEHLAPAHAGDSSDRLVTFVDFAPTVLSLAGVRIPEHMQGAAFAGDQAGAPRKYVHGFRDRMDERYDMQRCVRDHRYKYIRNFMPLAIYAQHIEYQWETPTQRIWEQMYRSGELNATQSMFFRPKFTEELYDTRIDPHEVNNLASDPAHAAALERLRAELARWMLEIRDLGLLPEVEMHARCTGASPYDLVRDKPEIFPVARILSLASRASLARREDADAFRQALLLEHDAACRYWAVMGLANSKDGSTETMRALHRAARSDSSIDVQVAAVDVLCGSTSVDDYLPQLVMWTRHQNPRVRLRAAIILDQLDEAARPVLDAIVTLIGDSDGDVRKVARKAVDDLRFN